MSVVLTTTISLSTAGLSQRSSSSVCSTILSCRVHRRQLTICFRSSKPIQISLCNVYADVVEHPPPQHASRRPIWSDMTSVDTVTQWRGDWSSASVVNHTIVTDPTVSGKGGNVTSAGWQVTLCDPMWHVSSRSSVANLRTAIHLLLTYLLTTAYEPATPNPGSRTRPQPAIDHYGAVSTFDDDNICETRFSMLCASCLELTTENCSR